MIELLAESIASGLSRKSVNTLSKWASKYRIMKKGPWSFNRHPWLKEMHDSKASLNVGQKAAQMGFTETVLNITLALMDMEQQDVLYLLPSKTPDASDFSSARFDPALEMSDHLTKMFSDTRNVGHKRAGAANLYIRGAQSRAGLKSIPVGTIIMDELEEFNSEAVPLAFERTSGQEKKLVWMISTPTIHNIGINKYFNDTTQEHFFFKCPSCGRMTTLTFPECLKITANNITDPQINESYYICKECENILPHETKSEWLTLENTEWVAAKPGRLARGFHINQLYSPTITAGELAISFLKGENNVEDEQEFFNSKLGLPHVVEGARVNDEVIDACIKNYKNSHTPNFNFPITMGIDVGKWLHFEINQWTIPTSSTDINISAHCKILKFGKVQHFEELDQLMVKYNVRSAIIDAHPEKRAALSFARKFRNRVRLCYYGNGISGKTVNVGSKPDEPTVHVDRTAWLDMSLGRFHNGTIDLPIDVDLEYRNHIKAPVRIYEKDKNNNPVGRYVNGSDDDHYAHARNYAEIALQFAFYNSKARDIGKIL